MLPKKELRHEALSYQIRGLLYETQNQLHIGWPEEAYHQGIVHLCKQREIPLESKPRQTLMHRGIEIHTFECDLIFSDLVIVELKVLPFTGFSPAHFGQLIHYLKFWKKDLGLLANFGSGKIKIERVVWDEPQIEIHTDLAAIQSKLTRQDESILQTLQTCLLAIAHQYGLGYPDTVYRKIAAIEFNHIGIHCLERVEIQAKMNNIILARHISTCLQIEQNILLMTCSLLESPSIYDFAQMKTFLNSLGLQIGVIANFGKRKFQIFGVSPD